MQSETNSLACGIRFLPNRVAPWEALRPNWASRNLGPNVDMPAMRVASVAPDRQRKMNVGFLSNNIADLRLKTCLVIHMGFNVFDSQISLSCFSCSFFILWKVWWCNNYITKLRTVQRPEFNSLHGRCGIPSNSHLKSLYLFSPPSRTSLNSTFEQVVTFPPLAWYQLSECFPINSSVILLCQRD